MNREIDKNLGLYDSKSLLKKLQAFRQVRMFEEFEELQAKELELKFDKIRNLEITDKPKQVTYIKNGRKLLITHGRSSTGEIVEIKKFKKEQEWAPTEVESFTDYRQDNPDIPTVQAFCEQGFNHPNEALDTQGGMNRAHFTECCVTAGKKLLTFHQNIKIKEPVHLRPEWIKKQLECTLDQACRFSMAFKRLGLDKKSVHSLMFGYTTEAGDGKIGLKAGKVKNPEYFEHLSEIFGLPLEPSDADSPETFTTVSEYSMFNALPEESVLHIRNIYKRPETQMEIMEDYDWEHDPYELMLPEEKAEMGINVIDSAVGVHPLGDESDGLRHEFINKIKEMNHKELSDLRQDMFPSQYRENVFISKPAVRNMTSSQKAQLWDYYRARKEVLYTKKERRIK